MSNTIEYAKREFKALGYDLDDKEEGPNKWIMENVFELLEIFSKQGHSGSSAPFAVRYFEKLALFKPLCPLTGKDDEWGEIFTNDGTMQNKRCSAVFKDPDGKAYYIDGKVWRDKKGFTYTNHRSRVYLKFPCIPTTKYVAAWRDKLPSLWCDIKHWRKKKKTIVETLQEGGYVAEKLAQTGSNN